MRHRTPPAEAPPSEPPAEPAAAMVTVRFASIPAGAEVVLDDESVGKTPLTLPLPASKDAHKIVFMAEGFVSATRTTQVKDGARIAVVLAPVKAAKKPADTVAVKPPPDKTADKTTTTKPFTGGVGGTLVATGSGTVRADRGKLVKLTVEIAPPGACGNGAVEGAEGRDDGNTDAGDGCDASCVVEEGFTCAGAPSVCTAICGDGLVSGAETCDDFDQGDGDGCSSACTVEAGWTCDAAEPSGCAPICGDGTRLGAEECDDNNANVGDGCDSTCAVEPGFTCDDTGCVSICGDGLVVGDEECDDDNTAIDDGCSSACAVEPGWTCSAGNPSICAPTDCGDGVVVGVEACYDGNLNAGDGCTPTCAVEAGFTCNGSPSARAATCGDGFKRGTEACDDANANDNDGCSSSCLVEGGFTCTGADLSTCSPICGDGQVKAGSCTLVTSLTASAGFDLDGFHVLTTSSAVDAAGLTSCPADDFDGDLRPINASCDVGADERP